MRGVALAAAAAAAAVVVSGADASDGFAYLDNQSFRPPFNQFDAVGMRTIDNWRKGGDAVINENFVRLTPDRQNKKGWLWSRTKMAAEVWTATVRFRVSGQGKRLFGDGLAFWFTTSAYPADGPVHGFADVFTGFGERSARGASVRRCVLAAHACVLHLCRWWWCWRCCCCCRRRV